MIDVLTALAAGARLPYLAGAALLVLAGAPKVRAPLPLVRAVRSVGVRVGRRTMGAFALTETLLGGLALVLPARPVAGAVALLYAGFTGFVLLAMRRGGVLESCGCFGKADTPPTTTHAAITTAMAVVAAAVAVRPPDRLWAGASPAVAGELALTALLTFLCWQVLAVLPSLHPAAVRSIRPAAAGGR